MQRLYTGVLTFVLSSAILGSSACSNRKEPTGGAPAAPASSLKAETVGNKTCPVSGKPVAGSPESPSFHSDFRGRRVGFMCPNCKATFDSSPAAKKLALTNKALGAAGKKPIK